jgi:betaine-homocysteine S-methyltransferase
LSTASTAATGEPDLLRRLAEGPVICAEGYLFEFERRGYVQAGPYVPEVVLEHPEVVAALHREFVHAGSDIVEAFTYYAHRAKLATIGKEHLLEALNRQALEIARVVASETDALLAGNICNTNVFVPDDREAALSARAMFEEQVQWAVDAGVAFVIAETFMYAGEALLAVDVVKGAGLPVVVTLAILGSGRTREEWPLDAACQRLEAAGADVVGPNCVRGPATMLPLLKQIRAAVSCHVAGLPVPYRTTEESPTSTSFNDPYCTCIPNDEPFPTALEPFLCNRYEIAEFGRQAYDMGIRYIGVCCGNAPHYVRSLAEAVGRKPPASRYSPDMGLRDPDAARALAE